MSEKIYVGNGREKEFESGGSVINVHLTLDKIKEYFELYGYTAKNGERRIKLNIASRREQGEYGETHTVTVDTWKPESAGNSDPFGEKAEEDKNVQSAQNESTGFDSYNGGGSFEDDIPF